MKIAGAGSNFKRLYLLNQKELAVRTWLSGCKLPSDILNIGT